MSINLLPNNLKNREKSELKKAKKALKDDIQMSIPANSGKKKAEENKKKAYSRGFSIFSFFSKKDKGGDKKNKVFLKETLNKGLGELKSSEIIKKPKINEIKRKGEISEITKIDSKIQKQDVEYHIKKGEPNKINVKEKIQTFQDYKKSKTEEQKIKKNNSKQKKNNKIKPKDKLEVIDKKRISRNNSEVNFISGDLIGSVKIKIREKLFIMFFSFGLSVIILFSMYVLMAWYQGSIINKIDDIKKKIDETQSKIGAYEERKDEIVKFQAKLKAIDYLLENHIYCTNFLEVLEKYTLPNVYYKNLNSDIQGNVSISALTDSFTSVAKQLIVFQQAEDFVESVEINSAIFNVSPDSNNLSVDFDINLKVKKDTFLK